MHWLFLLSQNWLFLLVSEWLILPGSNNKFGYPENIESDGLRENLIPSLFF